MIHKSKLVVDHGYQRDVAATDAKVKRIASEWSWIALGVIIVGNRNGALHVIDGQHRVQAALKRSDIVDLPCIVFQTASAQVEAVGFLRANRNRKPMTTIDAFKALIMSKDPLAIKAESLVTSYGRRIAAVSAEGTFTAVGELMRCLQINEDATRRALVFVMSVSAGYGVHQKILKAAFEIESRSGGESLSDQYWVQRGCRIGRDGILKKINEALLYRGGGGAGVCAEGILTALNKGQRSRFFELK